MRPLSKLVVGVAAVTTASLAVSVADIASAGASGRTTTTRAAATSSYTPPAIQWHACDSPSLVRRNAQCGDLVVPLDYGHPHGTKIKVAVSRVAHTTTAASDYRGVMLVNPGGPGGSGLTLSVLKDYVPNGGGDGYDWIGFDPRGVGSSTPSLSCNPNFFHGDRPPYRPTSAAVMQHWINRSKAYAAACTKAPGHALFNHVKTTDSVKDMESLRKALHQSKISLYGFSYGTYLGQVYATLNPSRVFRFVFDGTVDPTRVFYKSNLDQDVAFQKTFTIYFTWLAKHSSIYHVGDTPQAVRKLFLATIAKLDKHAEGGVLGGDELTDDFTSAGYYVYEWETIAQAYSDYINKGDASALITRYQDNNPTTAGGDNGYALYLGTQCTDAPWPHSQAKLNRDSYRYDRKYDYFTWSNAWFNGPCAYWKYAAHRPVHVTGRNVHAKILMIGETFDAATPFSGSLVVRKLFPTASLIEGKNGSTHAGSLSGVACTDDAVAAYLKDGVVPKRLSGNRSDKICPPVPQPNPTAAARPAARTGVSAPLPAGIRATLQAAQLHR